VKKNKKLSELVCHLEKTNEELRKHINRLDIKITKLGEYQSKYSKLKMGYFKALSRIDGLEKDKKDQNYLIKHLKHKLHVAKLQKLEVDKEAGRSFERTNYHVTPLPRSQSPKLAIQS
jgi:predicted RNase H-like nuclease (RuvC/YqgF family)